MTEVELLNLIKFSPSNLMEFFDKSIKTLEAELPTYGVLKCEPVTYAAFE